MLAPSMLTPGPISSPPRWAVSPAAEMRIGHLADRKVEIGVRIRLVLERVVPPLPDVRAKPARDHDRVQGATMGRFDLRDPRGAVMRNRIHQVVLTAHRSKLTGGQVIERQVDGAAPAVTRPGGDISVREHLSPVHVRVVPDLRPAVLWLLCPAQEAIDGALRAITVQQKQAEAHGGGDFSSAFQGCTQRGRADDAIGQIAVHRFAGEVVPCRVLRIPAYSGYELVDKDEISVHRPLPVSASDTIRSITSASGNPAAAI